MLFAFCLVLQAKEQRLKYEMDSYFYEIVFDDERISLDEMKQAALLSPYVQLDAGTPFIMIGSIYGRVPDLVFDKLFIAPWLELWNPGYTDDLNSPEPDAAFLKNAAVNLRKGDEQIEILRQEKIPATLGPVKDYLLKNLEFYSEVQKTRYVYLKTGDTTKLRKILCEQCSCGEAQEELLHRASKNLTGKEKLRLTIEWYNPNAKLPRSANRYLSCGGLEEFPEGFRCNGTHALQAH